MADALDSGSSEVTLVEVQVLSLAPAVSLNFRYTGVKVI